MYKIKFRSLPLCVAALGTIMLTSIASKPGMAAPQPPAAALQGPPILSVNDPQNYLHLTADQQRKMNGFIIGIQVERQSLASNTTLTNAQKQAKFLAYIQTSRAQIKSLLTPAQRAINEQHEEVAAKYRAGFMDTVKKANALSVQLKASFTPAQSKTITTLGDAAKQQLTALQANTTLTMQQKQQQAQTIITTFNQQMGALMTPSQTAMVKQLDNYKLEASQLQRLAQSE